MGGDVGAVGGEVPEPEPGRVVELDPRDRPGELGVRELGPVEAGHGGRFGEERLPPRLEDRVEAAQHRERQDHPLVLGLLEVPPQDLGDRPDERLVGVDRVRAHVLSATTGGHKPVRHPTTGTLDSI